MIFHIAILVYRRVTDLCDGDQTWWICLGLRITSCMDCSSRCWSQSFDDCLERTNSHHWIQIQQWRLRFLELLKRHWSIHFLALFLEVEATPGTWLPQSINQPRIHCLWSDPVLVAGCRWCVSESCWLPGVLFFASCVLGLLILACVFSAKLMLAKDKSGDFRPFLCKNFGDPRNSNLAQG